ncbi:MAG: AAA family ATPase, partial [Candidatus Geothermarchaeales archaeon]
MEQDALTAEEVMKQFEETKDTEFQSYLWGKHKWIRTLYHPLLILTSGAYRFYRFSQLPREKRAKKAGKWAKAFRKSFDFPDVDVKDIVGRDKEISTLTQSINYHVVRDSDVIKAFKVPPPKVFVIKGGTGTGKTFLARAVQKDAFEEGIKAGVVIKPQTVKASEIFSMFYGASAARLASTLDAMFSTPGVILVDEAQQFVLQGSTSGGEGDSSSENVRVESELLQKVDLLQKKPIRAVLIFATDTYENLLPTLRRRSLPIDMDEGMDEEALLKISTRMAEKQGINLSPEKILQTIGQTLRAVGQSTISFGDVVRTFEGVSRLSGEEHLDASRQPTLEEFAKAAKSIRAYTETEATRTAKEAGQTIRPPDRYSDVGGLEGTKEDIVTEVTYALNPELARNVGFKPPGGLL